MMGFHCTIMEATQISPEALQQHFHEILTSKDLAEKVRDLREKTPNLNELTIFFLLISEVAKKIGIATETVKGLQQINQLASPALLEEIKKRFLSPMDAPTRVLDPQKIMSFRAETHGKVEQILHVSDTFSYDPEAYKLLKPAQKACIDYLMKLQPVLQKLGFYDENIPGTTHWTTRGKDRAGIPTREELDSSWRDLFYRNTVMIDKKECEAAVRCMRGEKFQGQLETLFALARGARDIMRNHDDARVNLSDSKRARIKGDFSLVWSSLMCKKRGIRIPPRSPDITDIARP